MHLDFYEWKIARYQGETDGSMHSPPTHDPSLPSDDNCWNALTAAVSELSPSSWRNEEGDGEEGTEEDDISLESYGAPAYIEDGITDGDKDAANALLELSGSSAHAYVRECVDGPIALAREVAIDLAPTNCGVGNGEASDCHAEGRGEGDDLGLVRYLRIAGVDYFKRPETRPSAGCGRQAPLSRFHGW